MKINELKSHIESLCSSNESGIYIFVYHVI